MSAQQNLIEAFQRQAGITSATEVETRWRSDSVFTGIFFPRHDSRPDGPKSQSMVSCTCGAQWNAHRYVDGACPTRVG